MNEPSAGCLPRRLRRTAAVGCLAVALAVPAFYQAAAQQVYDGRSSFYIDGRTPVDARTREQVEAYIQEQRIADQREAERLERLELFIFQDRIYTGTSYGRY